MNVVIIPSDGFVSVNGRGFGDLDLSWIAPEVHAVNWRGTSGEVQIVDPDTLMAVRNDEITDLAPFQQALEQWESARAIADAPADPPTLAERRAAVWEQIKAKRESLKSGGVKVGAHWYHSDADSRIQQLGLVIMGANMPAGLRWKTIDNGLVDMTPALAQQIFAATANWDATLFGIAEVHRDAVMASSNPEAYDWSAGWPAGYQGEVNQ